MGTLSRSDAQVAVVISGRDAIVYVCDGRKLGAWLGGSRSTAGLDLHGAQGVRVVGRLDTGVFRGTVTLPNGKRHSFIARPPGTGHGLFRRVRTVRGKRQTLGWIVTRRGLTGLEGPAPKRTVNTVQQVESGPGSVSPGGTGGGGTQTTPVLSCEELQGKIDNILRAMDLVKEQYEKGLIGSFDRDRKLGAQQGILDRLAGQGCE